MRLIRNNSLDIVILGLSITSSWGNGHATTYRGLVKALVQRGHRVLFLENDLPWYASHRHGAQIAGANVTLYRDTAELFSAFGSTVEKADVVIVGSYTPDGIAIGEWLMNTRAGVKAFYDIDTPVTMKGVDNGSTQYISCSLMKAYDLYLSFTGGRVLEILHAKYGVRMARRLYCSVDPELYYPEEAVANWDLGYMGTFSVDRAAAFGRLFAEPARRWKEGRFIVAGAMYPKSEAWPRNVRHVEHIDPEQHRAFYASQRFTLNLTRLPMLNAGYSPSVRLFEAAACATPVISDRWEGLEQVFEPGKEIVVAEDADDALACIREMPESQRAQIGRRARRRALAEHTAMHRAKEFERYIAELGH